MIRRTTVALALLTALLAPIVAATVRPATPVSGQSTSDKVTYFALGDSIASGHGLGDEDGTPDRRADPDKKRCRRSVPKPGDSRKAYPYYVAEHLKNSGYEVEFSTSNHLACSGATAANQTDPELIADKSLSNQVDDTLTKIRAIDRSEPILVSITIGANDFGFANPCNLFLWLFAAEQSDFENWADTTATVVRLRLKTEINRLLNESPNVSVVVTEAFNPFNRDSTFFNRAIGLLQNWNCGNFPDEYPSGMYERTEYAIGGLNSNIHTAVDGDVAQPDRATVTTGLASAFLDHAAPKDVLSIPIRAVLPAPGRWVGKGQCGGYPGGLTFSTTSTTWIQYPADSTSNSYSLPNVGPVFNDATGDCFHPNEKGARAIAQAVAIAAYDVIYEPDPLTPLENGAAAEVADGGGALRGGPGESAVIRAELAAGTLVTITGEAEVTAEGVEWWPVTLDGTGEAGWVKGEDLVAVEDVSREGGEQYNFVISAMNCDGVPVSSATSCEPAVGVQFTVTTASGEPLGTCTTSGPSGADAIYGVCSVQVPFGTTVIVTEDVSTIPAGYAPLENPIPVETPPTLVDGVSLDVVFWNGPQRAS